MKRAMKKRPKIQELSNGDYVLMKGVSPIMVDQVMASVPDPVVPTVILDGTNEEYPNPNDPHYLRSMELAQSARERRSLHAIVFFGLRLCDSEGNPIDAPDDGWELRLRMAGVDWKKETEAITGELTDEEVSFARASAYLMFVAISADDMSFIMKLAGVDDEEQRKAAAMFSSTEE